MAALIELILFDYRVCLFILIIPANYSQRPYYKLFNYLILLL